MSLYIDLNDLRLTIPTVSSAPMPTIDLTNYSIDYATTRTIIKAAYCCAASTIVIPFGVYSNTSGPL